MDSFEAVCIDNNQAIAALTIGEIYMITMEGLDYYLVDDDGEERICKAERFNMIDSEYNREYAAMGV